MRVSWQESEDNTVSFTVSQADGLQLTKDSIVALLSKSNALSVVSEQPSEVFIFFPWWTQL